MVNRLLQRNIEYLQQYGIKDVVVNVHHFADQIIEAYKKNKDGEVISRSVMKRDELLETGGGLLKAKEFFNPVKDLSLAMLIFLQILILINCSLFIKKKSINQFAVTKRKTSRYLLFDENDRLCGWRNTTTGEEKIVDPKNSILLKKHTVALLFLNGIFSLWKKRFRRKIFTD